MPFGPKNAPNTFRRAMDVILSTAKWQFVFVYVDDIAIFRRTVEEQLYHIRIILKLGLRAGVSLKLEECPFFEDLIDYLDHVIQPRRLKISAKAMNAITGLQDPTKVTELNCFLGLCIVLRRFVPNFAQIAALLNKKLRKNQLIHFESLNKSEIDALKMSKHNLLSLPILALSTPTGYYTLDTDACDKLIGCVLLQDQLEGPAKPMG